MNQVISPKILIAAMGTGETSFAVALGAYAKKRGASISFALQYPETLSFIDRDDLSGTILTPDPESLLSHVAKLNPDVFVVINSKMFQNSEAFRLQGPNPKPLCITLDSNWLFSDRPNSIFKFLTWADVYLINLPPAVFQLGLKENGGDYSINKAMLKKIEPVGLIPSYPIIPEINLQKLRTSEGIAPDEKCIFVYSGYGATNNASAIQNIFPIVAELNAQKRKVKIIFVGHKDTIPAQYQGASWLMQKERLPANLFYELLSSSDLVYQHQGIGTLSQAISARRPIIVNVSDPLLVNMNGEHAHAWEVGPFARVGACAILTTNATQEVHRFKIEELLFDKESQISMKMAQESISNSGEEKVYSIIRELLLARNNHVA